MAKSTKKADAGAPDSGTGGSGFDGIGTQVPAIFGPFDRRGVGGDVNERPPGGSQ